MGAAAQRGGCGAIAGTQRGRRALPRGRPAFDRTAPPPEALGRIRDAFTTTTTKGVLVHHDTGGALSVRPGCWCVSCQLLCDRQRGVDPRGVQLLIGRHRDAQLVDVALVV
jgi:hypothetical protein